MTSSHLLAHPGPQCSYFLRHGRGVALCPNFLPATDPGLCCPYCPYLAFPEILVEGVQWATQDAEMALYCWEWRVTSIGCPDCEEEYLRVSFDWAQLSLLGDGGSTNSPRGRRVRDSLRSLGTKSGRRPQCEAWATRGPYLLPRSAEMAAGVLSPQPCKL